LFSLFERPNPWRGCRPQRPSITLSFCVVSLTV
jgi:hypothetical protein